MDVGGGGRDVFAQPQQGDAGPQNGRKFTILSVGGWKSATLKEVKGAALCLPPTRYLNTSDANPFSLTMISLTSASPASRWISGSRCHIGICASKYSITTNREMFDDRNSWDMC